MQRKAPADSTSAPVAPGEAGTDRHRVDDRVPRGPSVIALPAVHGWTDPVTLVTITRVG